MSAPKVMKRSKLPSPGKAVPCERCGRMIGHTSAYRTFDGLVVCKTDCAPQQQAAQW